MSYCSSLMLSVSSETSDKKEEENNNGGLPAIPCGHTHSVLEQLEKLSAMLWRFGGHDAHLSQR